MGALSQIFPAAAPGIEGAGRTATHYAWGDIVDVIFWAAFDSTSMIFARGCGCADAVNLFGNVFNAWAPWNELHESGKRCLIDATTTHPRLNVQKSNGRKQQASAAAEWSPRREPR
jgi:hypothetical protein